MNIKKIFVIFLVNIILLCILVEIGCFIHNTKNRQHKVTYSWFEIKSFDKLYDMIKREKLRKPIGLEYKNKPILLLGCSYNYGYGLNENETFAYLLSEKMKRPLYNRAFEWNWGLNTMLYQARREDFYKEVPNPAYIIYTFTVDHMEKANCSCYDTVFPYPMLRYVKRNGRLERERFAWRYNLHMFRTYSEFRVYKYSKEYLENSINEFFIETKQEFDKHWKDYKFIILVYERDNSYIKSEHNKNWEELEKQGFIVLSTSDLTGRVMDKKEDFISDNYHPNSEAWKLIVPEFIKRIEKVK